MEYKNPVYTEFGFIDCEINHPIHGWIPTTLAPSDENPENRALFEQIHQAGEAAPFVKALPSAEYLLSRLIKVCDQKQNDAIKLLIGYKATPGQLERYKRKYERALAGVFSAEENAAIISAHEGFLHAIDSFADMIEYARINTAGLIEAGELAKAEAIIEQAEAFDSTTTMEQVQSLFV